jgi:hypothetical protein
MPDPRRLTLLSIEENGLTYELSVTKVDPKVLDGTLVDTLELEPHVVVRTTDEG